MSSILPSLRGEAEISMCLSTASESRRVVVIIRVIAEHLKPAGRAHEIGVRRTEMRLKSEAAAVMI